MPKNRPSQFEIAIASVLRQRRIALGLSQAHLASQLGITYQQMQKYELGRDRISVGRFKQLAELLKLDPKAFF